MGKKLPIISEEKRIRPENSEVERLCADNSKAKQILNWSPRFKLEDGLSLTIDWLREHNEQYRSDAYVI